MRLAVGRERRRKFAEQLMGPALSGPGGETRSDSHKDDALLLAHIPQPHLPTGIVRYFGCDTESNPTTVSIDTDLFKSLSRLAYPSSTDKTATNDNSIRRDFFSARKVAALDEWI